MYILGTLYCVNFVTFVVVLINFMFDEYHVPFRTLLLYNKNKKLNLKIHFYLKNRLKFELPKR